MTWWFVNLFLVLLGSEVALTTLPSSEITLANDSVRDKLAFMMGHEVESCGASRVSTDHELHVIRD